MAPSPSVTAGALATVAKDANGCVIVRLAPWRLGHCRESSHQQAAAVLKAIEGYATCDEVKVIFFAALGEVIGGTPLEAPPSSACGGAVDALAAALDGLPQLLVGLVDRRACAAEACLFASCDLVCATAGVEFDLVEGGASGCACVPLALLRLLGADGLLADASRASGGPVRVGARRALELGLASEVVQDIRLLRQRWDELSTKCTSSPAAVVALRRRRQLRVNPATAGAAKRAMSPGEAPSAPPRKRAATAAVEFAARGRWRAAAATLVGGSAPGQVLIGGLLEDLEASGPGEAGGHRDKVRSLLHGALSEVEGREQRAAEEAQALLDCTEEERSSRETALHGAEASAAKLEGAIHSRAEELSAATGALRAAAAAAKAAREREHECEEACQIWQQEARKTAGACKGARDMHRNAKGGPAAKRQAEALVALGKDQGLDGTLLAGALPALSLRPDQRGSFDAVVLEAFESLLASRAEDLEGEQVKAAAARDEAAKAARVAWSAHEAALPAQRERAHALERVRAAAQDARLSASAARACWASMDVEVHEVLAERDAARAAARAVQLC